jgi:hypothetical protein
MKSLILSLLIVSSALATDTTRTPSLRPTAEDLSVAVFDKYAPDPLTWFRGKTATQVQRDAVESALTGIAMPRVIQFAKKLPGCSGSALTYVLTNYSKITSKLGPLYEAQSMKNGSWQVTTSGRHYHFEHYNERKIRDCAITSSQAALCASVITPELKGYLNIAVVNGKCVKGNIAVADPVETFDSARGVLGMVKTKNPLVQPLPDATEASLLDAADAAHTALSPTTGAARLAAEDSADTETEHHLFRMKDFMSDVDPGWSPEQVMGWHRLQNRFFGCWKDNVKRGNWFAARQCDTDHQLAHICAAVKDDRLLVMFSCPAGLGFTGSMDKCEVSDCQTALNRLNP